MTTSQKILEIIPRGHENALTAQEIATGLNLDTRSIRAIITTLRIDGIPVVSSASSPYGLFIAKNKAELERFTRQERNRACSTLTAVANLEKNLQSQYFDENNP